MLFPSTPRKFKLCLVAVGVLVLVWQSVFLFSPEHTYEKEFIPYTFPAELPADWVNFTGFDTVRGSANGELIVPNLVHYLRFDQPEFTFIEFICILSALQRQKPDRILFHTNLSNFTGRYWGKLLAMPSFQRVFQIQFRERPKHIFGQVFDNEFGLFHSTDVARMQVLIEYGGIFMDSDVYVSQSMDELRVFEFSVGWPQGYNFGTQVLVGHRYARFPRQYLETYRGAYNAKLWYYNAGERPTEVVLKRWPDIIHREDKRIWVDWYRLCTHLFVGRWTAWRTQTLAVHLFQRHTGSCKWQGWWAGLTYPVEFSEENILQYNVTIQDMVLDVYPQLQPEDV